MNLFYLIDEFILSLWDDVKKFTTKAYLWYSSNKNFVELRFNKDCIKLQLRNWTYSDPFNMLVDTYEASGRSCAMRAVVSTIDDFEKAKDLIKQSYYMVK